MIIYEFWWPIWELFDMIGGCDYFTISQETSGVRSPATSCGIPKHMEHVDISWGTKCPIFLTIIGGLTHGHPFSDDAQVLRTQLCIGQHVERLVHLLKRFLLWKMRQGFWQWTLNAAFYIGFGVKFH